MQDGRKAVWSIPYVSVAFFPSLKQNIIVYLSSKVSSRPESIFELHQLWQSGFSRVYSNSCCSCWFEPEILKIGQSSHKIDSNKILNFQESTTILNAHTKKVWKLNACTSLLDVFLDVHVCVCVCIFVCVCIYIYIHNHTMTDVYTAWLLPTKPSSHDDSGFRYGFGVKASLPLAQDALAVTRNTTRLCWIDITL